jgi:hypothetical protein
LRNLSEIIGSYLALLYEIYVGSRAKYSSRPRRVPVKLINLHYAQATMESFDWK